MAKSKARARPTPRQRLAEALGRIAEDAEGLRALLDAGAIPARAREALAGHISESVQEVGEHIRIVRGVFTLVEEYTAGRAGQPNALRKSRRR
jgi:hypothetical protein